MRLPCIPHRCIAWNQKRDRIVPDIVIERMYKSLQDQNPVVAEGFAAVKEIDVTSPQFDIQQIDIQIKSLSRSIINRTNRTRHRHITLHSYSNLLDFERLMHLISLIIRYPGIGNLQVNHPSLVESIFGTVPQFVSALEEVSAFMGKLCGKIYADRDAIASDLNWLQQNGLIIPLLVTEATQNASSNGSDQIVPMFPLIPLLVTEATPKL